MGNKTTTGNTIAVIPFHLKENKKEDFLNFLNTRKYLIIDEFKANSDYYQDHIENIWKSEDGSGFLTCYGFDNHIHQKIQKKVFYPFNAVDNSFKFGKTQIILNKKSTYENRLFGYLLVTFQWQGSFDLEEFSKMEFFRMHNLKEKKDKKPQKKNQFIEVKKVSDESANPEGKKELLTLKNYLDDLLIPKSESNESLGSSNWGEIKNYITFPHQRPYLMHIFHCEQREPEINNLVHAYKMIRIPKQEDSMEFTEDFRLWVDSILVNNMLNHSVEFYAMSEGALVLDYGNETAATIFNNYFPAFLLALNQREVQLLLSTEFSKIKPEGDNYYDPKSLKITEGDFVKIRFDQHFKSVSRNTEVGLFFKSMQKIFLVDEVLIDNDDKIKDLKELVDQAERKSQEREEKKNREEKERLKEEDERKEKNRERKLNGLLLVIAVFSVFSAVNDTFDLFELSKDKFHFISAGLLIGIIYMIYHFLANKNNQ